VRFPRHRRYCLSTLTSRSERRTTSRAMPSPSSSPASVEYRKCQPRRTRESAHSNAAARKLANVRVDARRVRSRAGGPGGSRSLQQIPSTIPRTQFDPPSGPDCRWQHDESTGQNGFAHQRAAGLCGFLDYSCVAHHIDSCVQSDLPDRSRTGMQSSRRSFPATHEEIGVRILGGAVVCSTIPANRKVSE
jgi:hypothetical protein